MLKELLISFLICLVIGAIINGWNASNPPPVPEATPSSGEQTVDPGQGDTGSVAPPAGSSDGGISGKDSKELKAPETGDSSFERDVLKSKQPVLVDFNASWCAPCQTMAPIIDTLYADYRGKAKVYRVDTERNPGLTDRFQVSALPTFMMFRNGRPVSKYTGAMAKEMLAGVIDTQLGTQ